MERQFRKHLGWQRGEVWHMPQAVAQSAGRGLFTKSNNLSMGGSRFLPTTHKNPVTHELKS